MPEAFTKKDKPRSPIKEENLNRAAGRSLRQKRIDVFLEEFVWPALLIAVVASMTIAEWIRYFWPYPPMPLVATTILLVFIVMGAFRMRKALKKHKQLRMAEDGEKYVGQILEELRRYGYEAFHDIVEEEGNIDHVLVGPGGVLVIETKTRSKPGHGKAEVVYDGEKIWVNGQSADRDPIVQAKACARAVRKRIKDGTGIDVQVQAVVVYPGWFVKMSVRDPEVWVMNETYLAKIIKGKGRLLGDQEVGIVAGQIRMWARERQKEEAKS